ncbi:MAG: YARHG domain-containing protein [candidate division WOR-3 bacterium]
MKRWVFVSTFWTVGFLLANDTAVWEYPDGSGVIPMSEDGIQMVAETVIVRVKKDTRVEVEARFTFKNHSDKSLKVTMGFPFYENWGEMWEPGFNEIPNAKDSLKFVSIVDGKEVQVRIRSDLTESENIPIWNKRFFFVWDVDFAPGQTRRLITRYQTDWDKWYNVDAMFGYTFTYITTTGAAWAGRIEDAVISIEIPKKLPKPRWGEGSIVYWRLTPPEASLNPESTRVVWHFTNWEPEEDISIAVLGQEYNIYHEALIVEEVCSLVVEGRPLTEDEIRNLFIPYGFSKRGVIRVLINTLYAKAGHRFKEKEWDELFRQFDWYKPKKALKFKDLPESYQKTIEAAKRVEEEQIALEERVRGGPYGEFMNEFAVVFFYPYYWDFSETKIEHMLPPEKEKQRAWLRLARNAFYARAGYKFEDKELAEFFSVMPWYNPNAEFEGLGMGEAEAVLSILRYEEKLGFR